MQMIQVRQVQIFHQECLWKSHGAHGNWAMQKANHAQAAALRSLRPLLTRKQNSYETSTTSSSKTMT
jgi:hypothetical protein